MPAELPSPPLSQAVEEYLSFLELERHCSPGTVSEYRADLRRFGEFAGRHRESEITVGEIDRDLVRAYQRSVGQARSTYAGRAGRPAAATTRHRRLVSLRSFLRHAAAREGWLPGDLGAMITLPKLAERLPKPLEEADRHRLQDRLAGGTLQEKRDRALILLLLSTGARISEALRLDRDDWSGDRVTVRGKGDRERMVMLTAGAVRAVDDYLAARSDPSPALFISFQPAAKGSPENRLTPQGARAACRRLAAEFGIHTFHPHQLRHTLGTLLQEELGDARLTAETLGHVGLGSVSGYTKISQGRWEQARETLQERGL